MSNKVFGLVVFMLAFLWYHYQTQIEIMMSVTIVVAGVVVVTVGAGALVYGVYYLKNSIATMELKTQALAVANAVASQTNFVLNHDQVLMTNNPRIALADYSHYAPNGGHKALPMPQVELDDEEDEPAALLDLLTVMTSSPNQVYAIIGGQQLGKTWQAHHVLHAWRQNGAETWVIAPKWDADEWTFVDRKFGGGADWDAVSNGLDELLDEIKRRHADTTVSHKSHKVLAVVIDDVTPLVNNIDTFADFMMTATTLSASVNVVIIFLIHSDTREAWGVGVKGKALTTSFVKLFLSPSYTQSGELVRGGASGMVCFSGERIGKPVKLLNTPKPTVANNVTASVTLAQANVTQGLTFVTTKFDYETWLLQNPVTPDLTREQRMGRLYALVSNDVTSLSQLVKACYGADGGKQRNNVCAMLSELGYIVADNKVQIYAK